jgi:geranylgeranylglycerol-phosphate geranylgeranyltransferase
MAHKNKEIHLDIEANKRDKNNNNNRTTYKEKIESVSSLSNNLHSFALSQILLLQSRKKNGIVFALAALVGIVSILPFSMVGSNTQAMMINQLDFLRNNNNDNNMPTLLILILKITLLPMISFLIIVGMYVFNDLIDADLDKINGKKRPIPMGSVSKKQAWIFIMLTNGLGIIFSIITLSFNIITMTSMLVTIGILYSIPKIALKDRFIVKTLSISLAMMLCLMIGSSAVVIITTAVDDNNNIKYIINPPSSSTTIIKNQKSNDNNHSNFGKPNHNISLSNSTIIISIYSAVMLGIMVFITSPINDLADISGDKSVGRKTIPIVIGKENTVKLAILLAAGLSIISIITYSLFPISIGIYSLLFVSMASILITATMTKTLKRINEPDNISRFFKKKTLPLHLILQGSLMAGSMSLLLFSH